MDSNGTAQLTESPLRVRRVAIIGTPPGLGMGPTLIAASPSFRAYDGAVVGPPLAAANGSGSVTPASLRN
jgi:hypothetical protein